VPQVEIGFYSPAAMVLRACCLGLLLCTLAACSEISRGTESPELTDFPPGRILQSAPRISNSSQWFEIIELPNGVYALWEPGHAEKVNSFLITGANKDVLYDTGMGIASIGQAVSELRDALGRNQIPLMVINSHNHLDHNGGNSDFEEAWIIRDEWAIRKLTEGLSAGFAEYWADLTPHAGVTVPDGFDAATFSIPPFPLERIRYLADGDVVDLGSRKFRVIHTTSHSPDGLALYDETNQLFFGGDTFLGDHFMVFNLELLEQDLARVSKLPIQWHYSSHGNQLIETMREGQRLAIVRRMISGERKEDSVVFAAWEFPVYILDGVEVILAPDFLAY
jgi:glyoxylase-like metal-dependent hydrolase (beta-lactamase superfamily II)